MTATINVFSMPQVVTMTFAPTYGDGLMNYPVNRTDFTVPKGLTTEIHFFVKDVDRRAVNLANSNAVPTAVIVDTHRQKTLLERDMDLINPTKGLYMLTLEPSDVVDWPLGQLEYSVIVERENGTKVFLYTDRDYGPYSALKVVHGPYATPKEAIEIPADQFTPQSFNYMNQFPEYIAGAFQGAAQVGNISGMQSAVFHMTGFIGNLLIQGSLEDQPSSNDSDWFNVNTATFSEPTDGPIYMDAIGNLVWVRFLVQVLGFDTFANTFQGVTYRND
jgi:hypothetical protein